VKAAVCLFALLSGSLACRTSERPIRVGSKNFSESVLLGEVAAQALEREGLRVDRRLNLGGTFVCHRAIVAGELDLYPEYTGTAFTAILKEKPVSDLAAVRDRVAREYEKRWRLAWSAPLGFENTFALIVRSGDSRRLGLRKISDLSSHAENLRPGFGYEFIEREDGFKGLARAYGLHFGHPPAEMDLGLLYPALESGKVDVIAGNSTDGLIAAMGAVVLEDDRRYFPPYEAAYVVSPRAWQLAAVRRALERLSGRIDAATMRKFNAEIDRDKRSPEQVARELLASL
jgi:glycine betaine/choline ABC-type transport system substrate-binding protein